MDSTIGVVGIVMAIFVSFAIALGLEWVSLVLLMKMMPARTQTQTTAQKFASVAEREPAAGAGLRKAA